MTIGGIGAVGPAARREGFDRCCIVPRNQKRIEFAEAIALDEQGHALIAVKDRREKLFVTGLQRRPFGERKLLASEHCHTLFARTLAVGIDCSMTVRQIAPTGILAG